MIPKYKKIPLTLALGNILLCMHLNKKHFNYTRTLLRPICVNFDAYGYKLIIYTKAVVTVISIHDIKLHLHQLSRLYHAATVIIYYYEQPVSAIVKH